jgi:hypothetical protein
MNGLGVCLERARSRVCTSWSVSNAIGLSRASVLRMLVAILLQHLC